MSSISTIKDVAARAGVAPSTVSKYINGGSVREKNVIAIREAMDRLNEREQRILNLRFFQGRTQMEVAGEIGISQAQVSRLEKAALSHMRKLV